jgi:hypothetical protein
MLDAAEQTYVSTSGAVDSGVPAPSTPQITVEQPLGELSTLHDYSQTHFVEPGNSSLAAPYYYTTQQPSYPSYSAGDQITQYLPIPNCNFTSGFASDRDLASSYYSSSSSNSPQSLPSSIISLSSSPSPYSFPTDLPHNHSFETYNPDIMASNVPTTQCNTTFIDDYITNYLGTVTHTGSFY